VLSFEMVKVGGSEALQIWCDDEGMNILLKTLETVRKLGPGNHVHLRGGQHLDPETPFGTPGISEIIIDFERSPE
jgi:hypothetical protein